MWDIPLCLLATDKYHHQTTIAVCKKHTVTKWDTYSGPREPPAGFEQKYKKEVKNVNVNIYIFQFPSYINIYILASFFF